MFRLGYNPEGNGSDCCDACNVADKSPAIILRWSGREGGNIIFIHERCLEKRIAAAKKKEARDVSKRD